MLLIQQQNRLLSSQIELTIFFLFDSGFFSILLQIQMSNFSEKSKEMKNQSSYKISVMKSKGLLKKQLNYDNIPMSKGAQKMEASSVQLVKSKILRYPPNYEPNRYMFSQCEEGGGSFCGCLSLDGLTKCEIYVSSSQAVSRKELAKSGCFQSFN